MTAAKTNSTRIAVLAIVFLVVLTTAVGIVAREQTRVLEKRNTVLFKVSDTQHDGIHIVRVSGLSGASAMSVKNISERKTDSSITVLVHIFLARSGTSGSFDYDVTVPPGVNEIRYGNDGVVIWQRSITDSQQKPGARS